jgi:hypothetical protein
VIWDDIQYLPKVKIAEPFAESLVPFRATQLLIHAAMVDDIITMHAARSRLKVWRAVDVRDSQSFQVVSDRRRIIKGETSVKL